MLSFEIINKFWKFKSFRAIAAIIFLFILLEALFPLPKLKPFSKEIHASDGTLLSAFLTEDDKWRLKTNFDEVSPELIKSIIKKEDSWFYWHPGVNPVAIIRAFFDNITTGKRKSGASTITMQVARLLEPKERTYLNKLFEIFRALQLEIKYSKRQILEIYLSLLPLGGNVEGVKSASYIYFNRPPDKLSLAQSITLAVIPNDPNLLRADRLNDDLLKMKKRWIDYFISEKTFPVKDLEDAQDEPLLFKRFSMPFIAPHFSNYINKNYSGDILYTGLNTKIQKTAENLLWNYVNRVNYKGITNGSAIIINNKDRSVIAYCGSADFNDKQSSGQVDGTIAIRSPGSTLKPALYAFAFDKGILTPGTMMHDIPTDFNGYSPENYDLKFYGNVSTEFALVNSLNIPAVSLLQKIGKSEFVNLLENCGFNEIANQKNKLGLSMILGGCGTTLQELVKLFSALACEGKVSALKFLKNEEEDESSKIFSKESSYLVAQILSGNFRNEMFSLNGYSRLQKFAWKTGTSYGKRDAWAIGFNPDYTIGVWMGNFNGEGSPHLSGIESAAPLLFDLFDAIDKKSNAVWFEKPENVIERGVCSESGLLPSKYCSDIIKDYAIEGKSNNNICTIHQPVYVSLDEKIQYCPECLPKDHYKKVVYPIYDPELTIWYFKQNKNFSLPPEHNHNCVAKFTNAGPKILSPAEDYEYLVEENSGQEILLQAASDSKVSEQYWYVNNQYYSKCKPGEKIFLKPENGDLKITCLDDKGREKTVNVTVKFY